MGASLTEQVTVDIYLSGCDKVLVGQDQQQHIEVARDLIKKYDPKAKLPEALIIQTESVLGFDGRKMSKSYNNTLTLDATDDEIRNFVRKIKTGTDVTEENSKTIQDLHYLITGEYPNIKRYGTAKAMLAQELIEFYNRNIR